MILWRISRHRDLSGTGGRKAAGRWHHVGHTIVYMTETPASALLEVCVHTSANDVPPAFTLLKIEGPDIEFASVKANDLRRNWQAQLEVTRDLGTAWLEKNDSALLRVPSAIVPETVNFLFNPSHKLAAKFRITDVFPYPFDLRETGRRSVSHHDHRSTVPTGFGCPLRGGQNQINHEELDL